MIINRNWAEYIALLLRKGEEIWWAEFAALITPLVWRPFRFEKSWTRTNYVFRNLLQNYHYFTLFKWNPDLWADFLKNPAEGVEHGWKCMYRTCPSIKSSQLVTAPLNFHWKKNHFLCVFYVTNSKPENNFWLLTTDNPGVLMVIKK